MTRKCENCEAEVSDTYARVFATNTGEVLGCPNCPDMTRGADGRARRSRNVGGEGR